LSETFNWQRHHGWIYRYFFVRHTTPVPEQFFANPDCRVVLLRTVGTWSVYERQACTPRLGALSIFMREFTRLQSAR
jgi:hypothetical protein